MWAALLGLILKPRNFADNLQFELRFQLLIATQWLLSLALIPLAIWIPESEVWEEGRRDRSDNRQKLTAGAAGVNDSAAPPRSLPYMPLSLGFVLALCLQFTGINACMNYAPSITKAAGFSPLMGNFIVMAWNFVATIASIPLSKRAKPHTLYLVGTLVASIACFVVGIVTVPDVVKSPTTRHVLSGLGIVVFIGAFEMAMGGSFYVLAQGVFPQHFRSKGISFTVMWNFGLNIIVNVVYPIAVVNVSGGPSKDQNKGMSTAFLFFAACGFCGFVYLLKFLRQATARAQNFDYDELS
jgi:hypothetical protein